MTSQKSLKNNVNFNDFKRSLKGSLLFPSIALVVLLISFAFPVILYVTSEEFQMMMSHEEVSMFVASNSLGSDLFTLFPMGMVICGMMTAIKSFYYMLRKNQVNVFFSLGVTRKTMFVNRTISGIISLFVSVLIPMLIIYIVNITTFDYVAHATELFLYAVSMFFVSGLAGFAIGTMATMISGNIFEAVLTTFTASAIPVLTVNAGSSIVYSYLNGFLNSGDGIPWFGLISPWNICSSIFFEPSNMGYNDTRSPVDVFLLITRNGVEAEKYVIPDSAKVDWGFVAPVVSWLVISIIVLGVGFILYKARKAEHANSFGHFAVSRAINATFVFMFLAFFVCELCYNISPLVYFIIFAVASAVAYFIVQIIMTRKLKTTVKSFKWYGVLVGVTAVFLAVIVSGLFGTFNKTPEKAEVKSVSISAFELEPYTHYLHNGDDEDFVEATSDNAKEAIIGLFDKVKDEKVQYNDDWFVGVTFAFRDNNNELKYRIFHINSEELYVEYLKAVYGSDFFDEILKEYLINDPPENEDEEMQEYYTENGDVYYYYGDTNNSAGYLKTKTWTFISNTGVYELIERENVESRSVPKVDWIEDSEALCKALYNDLIKQSYEQLFERKEKPLGILAMNDVYNDFMGANCMHDQSVTRPGFDMEIQRKYALVYNGIPVYADMVETVAFLKDNGYKVNGPELTIKEVLYTDSPLSIGNALQKFYVANESTYDKDSGYHYWIFDTVKDVTFTSGDLIWSTFSATSSFINNESLENVEMLKREYKDAGQPLSSITDKAKAEAVVNKAVPKYMTSGDNGRYIYIIYEEGPMVCQYLPEPNVGVLK